MSEGDYLQCMTAFTLCYNCLNSLLQQNWQLFAAFLISLHLNKNILRLTCKEHITDGGCLISFYILECYRSRMYPIEHHVAYAKQHYTSCAYSQCQLGIGVALERGQRIFTFLDVHRLHNQEVVVQGDDRID